MPATRVTSAGGAGLAAIRPRPGVHHEAVAPDGSLRASWRGFADWVGAAGLDGLAGVARDLEQARAESGIAFAALEETGTTPDPLPVILAASDWAAVEAGIRQRAELAEMALADLYGPAHLVAEGLLPPGIVYGSDAFAVQAAGWEIPPERYTYVYEADIARTAEGEWVVLADRVDAPLG
ncbi:MAG: circularly permuted type 2 ATP-grasp protein, partial [Pseudomonadota bacterium]